MGEPLPSDPVAFITWSIKAFRKSTYFTDRLGLPQLERSSNWASLQFKDDEAGKRRALYAATTASMDRLILEYSTRKDMKQAAKDKYPDLLNTVTDPLLREHGPVIWSSAQPRLTQGGYPDYPQQLVYDDDKDRQIIKTLLFCWIVDRTVRKLPSVSHDQDSVTPSNATPTALPKIPRTGQRHVKSSALRQIGARKTLSAVRSIDLSDTSESDGEDGLSDDETYHSSASGQVISTSASHEEPTSRQRPAVPVAQMVPLTVGNTTVTCLVSQNNGVDYQDTLGAPLVDIQRTVKRRDVSTNFPEDTRSKRHKGDDGQRQSNNEDSGPCRDSYPTRSLNGFPASVEIQNFPNLHLAKQAPLTSSGYNRNNATSSMRIMREASIDSTGDTITVAACDQELGVPELSVGADVHGVLEEPDASDTALLPGSPTVPELAQSNYPSLVVPLKLRGNAQAIRTMKQQLASSLLELLEGKLDNINPIVLSDTIVFTLSVWKADQGVLKKRYPARFQYYEGLFTRWRHALTSVHDYCEYTGFRGEQSKATSVFRSLPEQVQTVARRTLVHAARSLAELRSEEGFTTEKFSKDLADVLFQLTIYPTHTMWVDLLAKIVLDFNRVLLKWFD